MHSLRSLLTDHPPDPLVGGIDAEGLITQAVELAMPSQTAQAGALKTATGHEPPRSLSEFATSRLIRPEDAGTPDVVAVSRSQLVE